MTDKKSENQSQSGQDQQRQTPPPTKPQPSEKDVKPLTSEKPTGE